MQILEAAQLTFDLKVARSLNEYLCYKRGNNQDISKRCTEKLHICPLCFFTDP